MGRVGWWGIGCSGNCRRVLGHMLLLEVIVRSTIDQSIDRSLAL